MASGRVGSGQSGFNGRTGSYARRYGPSSGMIEQATMPPSGPYGYYFPYHSETRRFNFQSFNPAFCDGKVTIEELEAVNSDVARVPVLDVGACPGCSTRGLLGLLSLVVTAAVCGGTGGYFAAGVVRNPSYSSVNSSNNDTPQYFYKNLKPAQVAVIIPICAILGIGLACYLCCTGSSQLEALAVEYKNRFDQVFLNHQQTTFGPKDMTLQVSPHRRYLSVEFNWKAQELQVAKMAAIQNYNQSRTGGSMMSGGGGQVAPFPGHQQMRTNPSSGLPSHHNPMPGSIGYNQPPTNQFQPMSMASLQQK